MPLLYHLGILFYRVLLHLLAFFGHRKAGLWVNGRKNWRSRIQQKFKDHPPVIWFHCASLGEYELSVPLMEQIKNSHPDKQLLVTFFSPSGFEVRKHDPLAFHVDYLPTDSAWNARDFINYVHPEMVFFAKYDFWFHYLTELKKQRIPAYVFSATFRESQVFFKPYGKWYLRLLTLFSHLFVTNESSAELLRRHGINKVSVTGDNRYDRVFSTARKTIDFPLIEAFRQHDALLIAGSTWPEDERILSIYINDCRRDLKFIIAPHEIGEEHLRQLEEQLKVNTVRYSRLTVSSAPQFKVVIIDNIGMLSSLYTYGNMAYVGGAFKQGLHNILEPLSFGLPVIFGPQYKKYPEASDFISCGGAFSIQQETQLRETVESLLDASLQQRIKETNRQEVSRHIGATDKIMQTVTWNKQ